MADSLKLTFGLRHTPTADNAHSTVVPTTEITVSMAGTDYTSGTQSIGISEESLTFVADIASGDLGYILVRNLDDTNYVELNHDNVTAGKYTVKLKAGEIALFRLGEAATQLRALANTAACQIQYWLFED